MSIIRRDFWQTASGKPHLPVSDAHRTQTQIDFRAGYGIGGSVVMFKGNAEIVTDYIETAR